MANGTTGGGGGGGDTLQNFFINLGFKIDQTTLNQFNTTIQQTNNQLNHFVATVNNTTIRLNQSGGLTRGGSPFARQVAGFLASTAGISRIPGIGSIIGAAAEGGALGAMALGFLGVAAAVAIAGKVMVDTISRFSELQYAAQRMQVGVTSILSASYAEKQLGIQPGGLTGAFKEIMYRYQEMPGPTATWLRALGAKGVTAGGMATDQGKIDAIVSMVESWQEMKKHGQMALATSMARSAGFDRETAFSLINAKPGELRQRVEEAMKAYGDLTDLGTASQKLTKSFNELAMRFDAFIVDVLNPIIQFAAFITDPKKALNPPDDQKLFKKPLIDLHPFMLWLGKELGIDGGESPSPKSGKRSELPKVDIKGGKTFTGLGDDFFPQLGNQGFDQAKVIGDNPESLRRALRDLTNAIRDLMTGDSSFAVVRDCLKQLCSTAGGSVMAAFGGGTGGTGGGTGGRSSDTSSSGGRGGRGGHGDAGMRGHKLTEAGANMVNKIVTAFRSKGINDDAIAGVLANVDSESGFKPWVTGSAGEIGLFQMRGAEREGLRAYAAAHGLHESDADAQIGYLLQRLPQRYRRLWEAMKSGKYTAGQIADMWLRQYEQPAARYRAGRSAAYLRGVPGLEHYLKGGGVHDAPKDHGGGPIHIHQEDPRITRERMEKEREYAADMSDFARRRAEFYGAQLKSEHPVTAGVITQSSSPTPREHPFGRGWNKFTTDPNWLSERLHHFKSFHRYDQGASHVTSMNNTYHIHIAGYSNPHQAGQQVASHIDHTNRTMIRNFKTRVV